jgi:hypothetical protein
VGDSLFIANFSSRGPSGCDHSTIKPEVSAPGVAIRSSYLDGGYAVLSGTSMSAPHVAGAVALLRQYNPSATPGEIKLALMNSAADCGQPGEDNEYGWGVINVGLALQFMPGSTAANDMEPPRLQAILKNYPNPFNGSTVISIETHGIPHAVIAIHDIAGRLVKRIDAGQAGKIIWDGTDDNGSQVSTGIYLARLEGVKSISRKMILVK